MGQKIGDGIVKNGFQTLQCHRTPVSGWLVDQRQIDGGHLLGKHFGHKTFELRVELALVFGTECVDVIADDGDQFADKHFPEHIIIHIIVSKTQKSVIGLTLDLPVEERLEGTLVTTTLAVMKRCAFVRVHDVKENVRAIRMAEAIRDSLK